MVRVGFDGSLIHILGPIAVKVYDSEKVDEIVYIIGMVRVGFDGSLIHILGPIAIAANDP